MNEIKAQYLAALEAGDIITAGEIALAHPEFRLARFVDIPVDLELTDTGRAACEAERS